VLGLRAVAILALGPSLPSVISVLVDVGRLRRSRSGRLVVLPESSTAVAFGTGDEAALSTLGDLGTLPLALVVEG
jgi:hypothetical protein